MGEPRSKLDDLWHMLLDQGERVSTMVLESVEAFFDHDAQAASRVVLSDATVDHIDVEIERHCIVLLGEGVEGEYALRSVLTIVKINNEIERIGDCAVDIAEAAVSPLTVPPTARVMANSVVGMLRDSITALRQRDTALGRRVLSFDDTVEAFKAEILDAAQQSTASKHCPIGAPVPIRAERKTIRPCQEQLSRSRIKRRHHALREELHLTSVQPKETVVSKKRARLGIVLDAGHDVPTNRCSISTLCRRDAFSKQCKQWLASDRRRGKGALWSIPA